MEIQEPRRIHSPECIGDQRFGLGADISRQVLRSAGKVAAELVGQLGAGNGEDKGDQEQPDRPIGRPQRSAFRFGHGISRKSPGTVQGPAAPSGADSTVRRQGR